MTVEVFRRPCVEELGQKKTVVMKISSFLLFADYTKLGEASRLVTSGFENASVCDAAQGRLTLVVLKSLLSHYN